MATYKLTNIKLKTTRLKAILAVKTFFSLHNHSVSESVAKLDDLLQNGITFNHKGFVDQFEALNAFTYDLEEELDEYERYAMKAKIEYDRASEWYHTLSHKEREFVKILTKAAIPKA
jgi:hypothetical protein